MRCGDRPFDGQTLTIHSSAEGGVRSEPSGTNVAGTVIGRASYQPAADAGVTATGSTADIDATNMAAAFTVPASGIVVVHLGGKGYVPSTVGIAWGFREGTTDVVVPVECLYASNSQVNVAISRKFLVTGLTPGSSHTYKWTQKNSTGSGGGLLWGPTHGPAMMEILAA